MPCIQAHSIWSVKRERRGLALYEERLSAMARLTWGLVRRLTCKAPSLRLVNVTPPEGVDLVGVQKALIISLENADQEKEIYDNKSYCRWKKGVAPRARKVK